MGEFLGDPWRWDLWSLVIFPSFSNAIFIVLKLWSFNFQKSFVFFLASGLAEVVQDLLLNGLQLSDTSFSIMEQRLLQPGGFAIPL